MKTVLVVDDNCDARAIAGFALERAGYQVVEAEDGSHALRVVDALRESLALILLDLRMPIMDGWGFLAAAKDKPALADVPVVVLTADGRTDAVPGARQVLLKPCDPDHLVEIVDALC